MIFVKIYHPPKFIVFKQGIKGFFLKISKSCWVQNSTGYLQISMVWVMNRHANRIQHDFFCETPTWQTSKISFIALIGSVRLYFVSVHMGEIKCITTTNCRVARLCLRLERQILRFRLSVLYGHVQTRGLIERL